MKLSYLKLIVLSGLLLLLQACNNKNTDGKMLEVLEKTRLQMHDPQNIFSSDDKLTYLDGQIKMFANNGNGGMLQQQSFLKGLTLLECGRPEEAATIFDNILNQRNIPVWAKKDVLVFLALSYLRTGEQTNCVNNHSADACVFPIANGGIHKYLSGSKAAIEVYKEILRNDSTDLASRWLLNVAFMTVGSYPAAVPGELLIPNLDSNTTKDFKAFTDIGPQTGLAPGTWPAA